MWLFPQRNLCVGDVVLISDENQPRNEWRLCCVAETYTGGEGRVRSVKVLMFLFETLLRGRNVYFVYFYLVF